MIYQLLIFVCLVISTHSLIKCPKNTDIKPCKCFPITHEIHCIGISINDRMIARIGPKIQSVANEKFKLLFISNTRITKIPQNLFTSAIFEKVFIDRNSKLRKFDLRAFRNASINTLIIGNNPDLTITECKFI
jgi:hypothetical protein